MRSLITRSEENVMTKKKLMKHLISEEQEISDKDVDCEIIYHEEMSNQIRSEKV